MRIGTCGTGNVASWISGILQKKNDPTIELYACATAPGFDCSEFAQKFGYKKVYGSFAELYADPDVDVVYIATPNNFHFAMCKEAIEAGKNVICEKPFMVNAKEAEEIIRLAEEKGVFVMEAMWVSFLPSRQLIRDEIAAGTIGDIIGGEADDLNNVMFLPRVSSMELGGGYILDNGAYTVGWMTDMFGLDIEKVESEVRKLDTGVDAEDWITVTYKSGAVVKIHQMMDMPADQETRHTTIFGTKGSIWCEAVSNPQDIRVLDKDGNLIKKIPVPEQIVNPGMPPVAGYDYEFENVRDCLNAGLKESNIVTHHKMQVVADLMTKVRYDHGVVFPFEKV